MKELVTIQLGQCGNNVGCAFWESICKEHFIEVDGSVDFERRREDYKLEVLFSQTTATTRKVIPRVICIDTDPSTRDSIACFGPYSHLFPRDNFIFGTSCCGNNFARGFYTDGMELIEQTMDTIRRETEKTDNLQGFQIFHSLGGGTGTGFGSLLIECLKEEFPDRILSTSSIIPSCDSDCLVEPYNFVLSMSRLIDFIDLSICIDNKALIDILFKILHKTNISFYKDYNSLVTAALSGVSSFLRFQSIDHNRDLRFLTENLVPNQRLHFIVPSIAPISFGYPIRGLTLPKLTRQVFNYECMLCHEAYQEHQFPFRELISQIIFRGDELFLKQKQIDEFLLNEQSHSEKTGCWLPERFLQFCICKTQFNELNSNISATALHNGNLVISPLTRIQEQFRILSHRHAFQHWYFSEGMDELEFSEANENLTRLIEEYETEF